MLLLLLNYVVLRALWKIDVYLISTLVNKYIYYYYYYYYYIHCICVNVYMNYIVLQNIHYNYIHGTYTFQFSEEIQFTQKSTVVMEWRASLICINGLYISL